MQADNFSEKASGNISSTVVFAARDQMRESCQVAYHCTYVIVASLRFGKRADKVDADGVERLQRHRQRLIRACFLAPVDFGFLTDSAGLHKT